MDYITFFEKIEKYYFENNFSEVVELWETQNQEFRIDYSNKYDDKILEAVKVSYNKTGQLKKSLLLVDKQINLLHKLKIPKWEKEKNLKYYFNNRMSLQIEMRNTLLYYVTIRNYLSLWDNEQLDLDAKDIEKLYYKKLIRLNNISLYILIAILISFFVLKQLDYQFDYNFSLIYEFVTITWLIWLTFFWVFPRKAKEKFISTFRYIFKPKSLHLSLDNFI